MIRTKCYTPVTDWHQWFAWHPVTLRREPQNGQVCVTTVWWERIERRLACHYAGDWWEYRLIEEVDDVG